MGLQDDAEELERAWRAFLRAIRESPEFWVYFVVVYFVICGVAFMAWML